MHQYRIAAQTFFILSIFNLALAVPVEVREIYEARAGDGIVMAEPAGDVTATPNMSGESKPGVSSDKSTSPPPSPDAMATPQQHSPLSMPDGSVSSDSMPDLTTASSVSGYSWLLERPPRVNLGEDSSPPWSLELGSQPPSPDLQELGTLNWIRQLMAQVEAATPSPSSSLNSRPEQMSTPFSSASETSLSSHYVTASEGLGPSQHSISEVSHSEVSSTPSSEDANFFNKSVMKKLKIIAAVTVVGAIITGTAASQIQHRDSHDS